MAQAAARIGCRCGAVVLEAIGAPITATICHCAGCQEAGRILQQLPNAAAILDENGGTAFSLYRKDRATCVQGASHLREHRLTDTSPTRRILAVCCNSFLFLDFTKGHWISIATDRFTPTTPVAQTNFEGRQSTKFILRLLTAWARMGFRTPTIDYVKGRLSDGSA